MKINFNIINDGAGQQFSFEMSIYPHERRAEIIKWCWDVETSYNMDNSRRMHISITEDVQTVVKA